MPLVAKKWITFDDKRPQLPAPEKSLKRKVFVNDCNPIDMASYAVDMEHNTVLVYMYNATHAGNHVINPRSAIDYENSIWRRTNICHHFSHQNPKTLRTSHYFDKNEDSPGDILYITHLFITANPLLRSKVDEKTKLTPNQYDRLQRVDCIAFPYHPELTLLMKPNGKPKNLQDFTKKMSAAFHEAYNNGYTNVVLALNKHPNLTELQQAEICADVIRFWSPHFSYINVSVEEENCKNPIRTAIHAILSAKL